MWQDGCDSCSPLELDHKRNLHVCVGYDGLHIHHGMVYQKNDSIFVHLSGVGISIFPLAFTYPPGNQHIPSQNTFEDHFFAFPKVKYDEICWSNMMKYVGPLGG